MTYIHLSEQRHERKHLQRSISAPAATLAPGYEECRPRRLGLMLSLVFTLISGSRAATTRQAEVLLEVEEEA
jgi:hypothetical protein